MYAQAAAGMGKRSTGHTLLVRRKGQAVAAAPQLIPAHPSSPQLTSAHPNAPQLTLARACSPQLTPAHGNGNGNDKSCLIVPSRSVCA